MLPSFLRDAPPSGTVLPPPVSGAQMLGVIGREVFSSYVPSTDGPLFMRLIEKTFGKNVTTRTCDTVRKCAAA